MRDTALPPGPKAPAALQTIGFWTRPTAGVERLREQYGPRITTRIVGQPHTVILADPDDAKAVLTAPPDVLHPGAGARLLEPIIGPQSVILLDEAPHLEQRKLLLPAFHGDRMQALTELIEDLTARELDGWPTGEEIELHERFQALTLEIILRAVFGLDEGPRLDALRRLLPDMMAFGDNPLSMIPMFQVSIAGRGPFARFDRIRTEVDQHLFELIDERRAEGSAGRVDILGTLVDAEHTDGSPMTNEEIRDELLTALVAGHETTASSLAWACAEIARAPGIADELAAGDPAYLDAVINETLRRRPVLPNPEPRLVVKPFECGGYTYPPGVVLIVSAYLIHHDPDIYPDPYAFRPERFLGKKPGTYTWLPFGGGRRRCIGAAFATLEMRVALRETCRQFTLTATGPIRTRRRMITITPADAARVVLSARSRPAQTPANAEALAG